MYIDNRINLWNKFKENNALNELEYVPIQITFNDEIFEGISNITTPNDIAKNVSNKLAKTSIVANVNNILWDMNRPVEGDCSIEFIKYNDPQGKKVFAHSSAHVLG